MIKCKNCNQDFFVDSPICPKCGNTDVTEVFTGKKHYYWMLINYSKAKYIKCYTEEQMQVYSQRLGNYCKFILIA